MREASEGGDNRTESALLRLTSPNGLRGFWLTDLGQCVTAWLPVGEYVVGEVSRVRGYVVQSLRSQDGPTWFVPPAAVAARLRGE